VRDSPEPSFALVPGFSFEILILGMLKGIIFKLKLIFIPCEDNNYRPKFLDSQFLFYYLIVLLVLKLIVVPFFIYFPKSAFFADLTKTALTNFTNKARMALGIQTLKENPKLEEAAYLKAKDIIEKDYFSHQSPEGISPWDWFKKAGYDYKFAGENLAIGFLDSEEVHQAWLDSPSHKQNLLDPNYSEIGIAVLKGDFQGSETTVVVQLLGTPQPLPVEEKPETNLPLPEKEVLPEKEEIVSEETSPQLLEKNQKDILALNFLSFFSSDYFNLLQKIIYGSLILIIISLLINIFVRIDIQYKDLIFKTTGFIVLLIFFIFLDKEFLIQLIPHNFSIY